MRKTWTFADDKAPVRDHMAGLCMLLALWERRAAEESAGATTAKKREYHFGRSAAFSEIIAVIEDSNSI